MYHYVHMQKTQETSFRSPSKNLAGNVIWTYLNNLKKSWCVRLSFILYQAPKHWTSTASVGRPWSRWSEVVPCKNNTSDVAHRSMLKRTSVAPLCANLLNIQPWGSRWFCPHDILFFFSGYAVACNHHEVHTICTTWFHKKNIENTNRSLWDLLSFSLSLSLSRYGCQLSSDFLCLKSALPILLGTFHPLLFVWKIAQHRPAISSTMFWMPKWARKLAPSQQHSSKCPFEWTCFPIAMLYTTNIVPLKSKNRNAWNLCTNDTSRTKQVFQEWHTKTCAHCTT